MKSLSPEHNDLHDYVQAKLRVAELIRQARIQLDGAGRPGLAGHCQELQVRLAEERFNLAIVGQFKRGKSSLVNALVGKALLPTGMLPLTSVITALTYGPKEKAILVREGWAFDQEIGLDQLEEFTSERGNPGNEKGVMEARIETPAPLLKQNVYIVDTPGVGSSRKENTATTYGFLPKTDAIVFVTSVEAPFSETEKDFLLDVRQFVRRLFIVVNKIDLLPAGQGSDLLAYLDTRLLETLGPEFGGTLPLSATAGLQGRLGGNTEALEASGLAAFEAQLSGFLAHEKARTFLVSVLDGLERILAEGPADHDALTALSMTAANWKQHLLQSGSDAPDLTPPVSRHEVADLPDRPKTLVEDIPEIGLRATLTCPVCDAASRKVFDFFAVVQSGLANSPETADRFSRAHGFCRVHAWQFQALASAQGVSAAYAPLVEDLAEVLQGTVGADAEHAAVVVRGLEAHPDSCPACQIVHSEEQIQASAFLELVSTDGGKSAIGRSLGLCLRHLALVLDLQPPAETVDFLLSRQSHHLERLAEDMRTYVLKREALRRGLLNDDERNAWKRTLIQLVGESTAYVTDGA